MPSALEKHAEAEKAWSEHRNTPEHDHGRGALCPHLILRNVAYKAYTKTPHPSGGAAYE